MPPGATSSLTNWRWADGTVVASEEADWSGSSIQPSNRPEAIVLARVAEWKWIPSAQNVWNSFLCQSKPKSCTFPGISDAGRVSFTSANFAIGTRAVYSCELGYELIGDVERLCDETARWSGTIPKCRKKKCESLEVWRGGGIVRLLNETAEFGNEIQYECLSGWKLVGEERRRCQHDGSWSGTAPYCKSGGLRSSTLDFEWTSFRVDNDIQLTSELHLHRWVSSYRARQSHLCCEGNVGACRSCLLRHGDVARAERSQLDGESCRTRGFRRRARVYTCLRRVSDFQKQAKSVSISEKPPLPGATPPGLIYVTPSMLTNPQDSVVYYASSMPFTKMEIPPHLLSLKHLPNGNIEATLPIGRPFIRPQLPVFSSSPTPSQLLYSFDYEPIYDVPPDVQRRPETEQEENIYEKLPDVKPTP
ncbi:sushi domain protein [Ostertagia ostertagi]